jgi:hypothetical protein
MKNNNNNIKYCGKRYFGNPADFKTKFACIPLLKFQKLDFQQFLITCPASLKNVIKTTKAAQPRMIAQGNIISLSWTIRFPQYLCLTSYEWSQG